MFTESSANPILHLALEADWTQRYKLALTHMRDTHHEHPLLQVRVDTTLICIIRGDSPSRDIGSDQVDRRVDCGVCGVVFGSAHAGSEVGEN